MFNVHLKGEATIKSWRKVIGGCTAGSFMLGINCNAPISKFRH